MTGFVFIYFISPFIDLFIKWFAFREPEPGRFSIIAGPQYEDLYTSACSASFCHRCTNRLWAQLPSLFIYQNPHKLSGPWRMNQSYGCMRKLLQCLSFGNGIEAFENKGLLNGFLPLSLSLSLSPCIILWRDGRFVLQMPLSDTWVNSAVQSALLGWRMALLMRSDWTLLIASSMH